MPMPARVGTASTQMPVIGLPPGPRTTPVIVPLNRMLTFAPLVVFADVTETGPVSCAVVVGALLVHDGSAARIWYLPAARLPTSYLPPPAEMVNAADAVVLSGSSSTHVPGALL